MNRISGSRRCWMWRSTLKPIKKDRRRSMEYAIIIRLMQPADLNVLQLICRSAYSENFGHHWQEDGLSDYLEKVFGSDVLAAELADPDIRFYVAFREPV